MYFEKVKYSNRLIPKIAVEDAGLKNKKPQEFLEISPHTIVLGSYIIFPTKKGQSMYRERCKDFPCD